MSALLLDDYESRVIKPSVDTYSDLVPKHSFPQTLPLFEFRVGNQLRALRRPIKLQVGFEGDTFFVENESLALFGHGATLEEAVTNFLHDLEHLWSRYRALSDDELTGHGLELKKLLQSLSE